MAADGKTIDVTEARDAAALEDCLRIRRIVFVDEQKVPVEIEIDGEDPVCRHFLARVDGVALGAARMKRVDGAAKLQRIAVIKAARGTGLGAALVRHMIAAAKATDPSLDIVLGAQTYAIGFYEKLGFIAEGPEYLDADIPHRDMRLTGV